MKLITILSLLLGLCSQGVGAMISAKQTEVTLDSAVTGTPVTLQLALPYDYDAKRKTPYPLLITSAGDSRIAMLQSEVDWLSHVAFGPMPQLIVLRLPVLPPKDNERGGEEYDIARLAEVMKKEVLPALDSRFNTAPFRILEGFSTLGNLSLELFSRDPDSYQAAVINSPALELAEPATLKAISERLQSGLGKRYLFLSLGSFKGNRVHFNALSGVLAAAENARFADLSTENYLSTSTLGFERGMSELFADREIRDFAPYARDGVRAVLDYHQALADKYGYRQAPESNLEGLAEYYLARGELDKGRAVFEYLVQANPETPLFLVRYAQAMLGQGHKKEARSLFEQALHLAQKTGDQEGIDFIGRRLKDL